MQIVLRSVWWLGEPSGTCDELSYLVKRSCEKYRSIVLNESAAGVRLKGRGALPVSFDYGAKIRGIVRKSGRRCRRMIGKHGVLDSVLLKADLLQRASYIPCAVPLRNGDIDTLQMNIDLCGPVSSAWTDDNIIRFSQVRSCCQSSVSESPREPHRSRKVALERSCVTLDIDAQ